MKYILVHSHLVASIMCQIGPKPIGWKLDEKHSRMIVFAFERDILNEEIFKLAVRKAYFLEQDKIRRIRKARRGLHVSYGLRKDMETKKILIEEYFEQRKERERQCHLEEK